jgi:hypothetical protein
MKLLIVGGYGIFGGRIVELLQDEPCLTILVAGRSLPKARASCAREYSSAAGHMIDEKKRPSYRRVRTILPFTMTRSGRSPYARSAVAVVRAASANVVS